MRWQDLEKEKFIFRYVNGIDWGKYNNLRTAYYVENISCFNEPKDYRYYVVAFAYERLASETRDRYLKDCREPMTETKEIETMEDYSKVWEDGTKSFGFVLIKSIIDKIEPQIMDLKYEEAVEAQKRKLKEDSIYHSAEKKRAYRPKNKDDETTKLKKFAMALKSSLDDTTLSKGKKRSITRILDEDGPKIEDASGNKHGSKKDWYRLFDDSDLRTAIREHYHLKGADGCCVTDLMKELQPEDVEKIIKERNKLRDRSRT